MESGYDTVVSVSDCLKPLADAYAHIKIPPKIDMNAGGVMAACTGIVLRLSSKYFLPWCAKFPPDRLIWLSRALAGGGAEGRA